MDDGKQDSNLFVLFLPLIYFNFPCPIPSRQSLPILNCSKNTMSIALCLPLNKKTGFAVSHFASRHGSCRPKEEQIV